MITTATRTAAALLLGFGKYAANTVDATEDAAKDVSN